MRRRRRGTPATPGRRRCRGRGSRRAPRCGRPTWLPIGQVTARDYDDGDRRWLSTDERVEDIRVGTRRVPVVSRRVQQGHATPLQHESTVLVVRRVQDVLTRLLPSQPQIDLRFSGSRRPEQDDSAFRCLPKPGPNMRQDGDIALQGGEHGNELLLLRCQLTVLPVGWLRMITELAKLVVEHRQRVVERGLSSPLDQIRTE